MRLLFPLLAPAIFIAPSILAQESSALEQDAKSIDQELAPKALEAIAKALDQHFKTCGAKNRMPAPVHPAADADGCVDVAPFIQ